MGIYSGVVSFVQFSVKDTGEMSIFCGLPSEWVADRLANHLFQPIDATNADSALGWVTLDDRECDAIGVEDIRRGDDYLVFSLRRDQRKIPAMVFVATVERRKQKFLAENPGYQRVPKDRVEEIKEQVRLELLPKVLPTRQVVDVLWNMETDVVTFFSVSQGVVDGFVDLFHKTFTGLRLVEIHPMQRVREIDPRLEMVNKSAEGASVLEQIRDNAWIGTEFLEWLLVKTLAPDVLHLANEPTAYWLDDKLVMTGQGNEGQQKVTVCGAQDRFREVIFALQQGKQINEATIYMERQAHCWRLTLRGERFHFVSVKCPLQHPANRINQDDERLSVFYERVAVIEEGLALFDALLRAFLWMKRSAGESAAYADQRKAVLGF